MSCHKVVRMKRDVPRYTGRTKSGFEMHYVKVYCKLPVFRFDFCKRHQPPTSTPPAPEAKSED